MKERDRLIKVLLENGRSYVNQYEDEYRKLIEKFIKQLEKEIAKHLDYLQNDIEAKKQSIFQGANSNIQHITGEADRARDRFHQLLQQAAAVKRQEIIDLVETSSKDKTMQPLGYEQFRTIDVEMYSTVGTKKKGQCCEKIDETKRANFLNDIEKDKQSEPHIKRTIYIGQNVSTESNS